MEWSRSLRSTANQVRDVVSELAARHALPKDVVEGVTRRAALRRQAMADL